MLYVNGSLQIAGYFDFHPWEIYFDDNWNWGFQNYIGQGVELDSTTMLYLNNFPGGFPEDQPFHGRIDDFVVYDHALSAEEIAGLQ